MIAFVPISRYTVEYQLASGRPYSDFERLLLEAVQEGHSSLGGLADVFRVHRRVIVEGLVTLMQAGWITIKPDSSTFDVTSFGKQAIQQSDRLPPGIFISDRTASVILERVANQVALSSEVLFYPRSKLEKYWALATPIPKGDLPNSVDPGMIADLLPRGPGEWVKWIGPINLARDNADFVVLDVDVERRRLSGPVPARWEPFLGDELISRVEYRQAQVKAAARVDDSELREFALVQSLGAPEGEERGVGDVSWSLELTRQDLVVGSDAHQEEIKRCLRESTSYVALVSSFVSGSAVKALMPFLNEALARGVLIDVIWGELPDSLHEKDHSVGFELLKKLELETARSGTQGKFSLARQPADTHAKILLYDTHEGVQACLGSFNWLAAMPGPDRLDVSLRVRNAAPVARLCHLIADYSLRDERLSSGSGAVKLRNLAASMWATCSTEEESTAASSRSVKARLIIDRQHDFLLRQAVHSASSRIIVASHRMGPQTLKQLLPLLVRALDEQKTSIELRYGVADSDSKTVHSLSESLHKHGGNVVRDPHLHSKYVVVDDELAMISSYNWLCENTFTRRRYGVEIGVCLTGTGIGTGLLTACEELRPSQAKSTPRC